MANAASPAARQRPPALPVAAMTRVALMYPPMSRGISISDGTRPNGSLGASGTGVYCWIVSFCPALLAAFSNCTAMSSGDRSLMEGTTIRVLGAPDVVAGIRAPQILAWPDRGLDR